MNNQPRRLPFVIVLLLCQVLSGHAAVTQWRTQVQVSAGSGVGTQFAFDGGLNDPSSSQTLSYLSAFSEASSSLSASGYIPTLRTRATNSGTRSQAVAWGVQGYTNTATVPVDTSLLMNLTADLTGGNDLDARIYLFQDENFEFYQNAGTILFESSSQLWPGFEGFANNPGPTGFDILIGNYSGSVNEVRNFDFTVQPGDSFYVWAMLVSTADNRGVVDAYSTLTASLSNTNGLSPASIPEPGSALLLTLGSVLLVRRRSRS